MTARTTTAPRLKRPADPIMVARRIAREYASLREPERSYVKAKIAEADATPLPPIPEA